MIGSQKKRCWRILVFIVLGLFVNLPIVSALEISNVRAEIISPTEAEISWETDEPAGSFVDYGLSEETLGRVGDASQVVEHIVALSDIAPQSTYYFQVQSGEVIDNNDGSLYSFNTLAPDTTAPEINVELPAAVQGNRIDFSGTTEFGATVNVFVNGPLLRVVAADAALPDDPSQGRFTITDLALDSNKDNLVKIEVIDLAGNDASMQVTVFSDTSKPKLDLVVLPEFVSEKNFVLRGTISEESSYEIFIAEDSVAEGQGTALQAELSLEEGGNKIKIVITDKAGWVTEEEFNIISDTKAPKVEFDFAKGKEYYQGNAETDISGATEPGAEVYLFIFRPLTYEFTPTFNKAWEKVTADAQGRFTFEEVDLESPPISLEDLAPRQIPSGLNAETIFPIEQIQAAQKFTYHVYLVAEDKSGKTGYAKKLVNINTCYSADFDFDVQSLARFQAPLRLNPTLLDDGREEVTAVFNFSYRGKGISTQGQSAFQIQNVQFDKACTQGMLEDDSTKIGCNIFPQQPRLMPNADKTAWYITAPLFTTEKFSDKKEDFWDEFGRRQITFPLKIKITYRDNLGGGKMSDLKTQVSCYELGYFIDIPLESKNMIPDFLAEEGLDAIEFTIDKIDIVLPYLENAILVTGIAWVSSFIGKLAVRYARLVSSKLEAFFSKGKAKNEQCPGDQEKYYTKSEIQHWRELKARGLLEGEERLRKDWEDESQSIEELCPSTAGLWEAEKVIDQAYRWTGDRVLCRTVPAGWTSTKDKPEIDTVIAGQNQCTASSRGVPLLEIENCGKRIEENTNIANPNAKAARLVDEGEFTCYQSGDFLYYANQDSATTLQNGGSLVRLERVHDFGLSIQQAGLYAGAGDLIAYQPPGSDQYVIGQDKTCEQACKNPRKSGYRAYVEKGLRTVTADGQEGSFGCFQERVNEFGDINPVGVATQDNPNDPQGIGSRQFSAGYTRDCFIDYQKGGVTPGDANINNPCNVHDDCTGGALCLSGVCSAPPSNSVALKGSTDTTTGLLQCVCTYDEKQVKHYPGVRTAMKEQNGIAEEWSYHQQQVFKESNNRFGTYYPEWRYYGGRDFSSAFGADYLLDYFQSDKQVHQVSPNTQFLGAYQTVCLSRVRAHLITLKAILEGLRNCIQEAKYTGLRDAGVCKTIFTQQVCGLVYKAIAYFVNQCSPFDFNDESKGTLGGIGAVTEATFGSIGEAMQSSIDDVKSDYGNAQLNNYFAAGAEGLTQSMCMAAFGYDWPLGADFILDAAYAVPGKTTVHVIPAHRELSTYDPSSGNAVYNYEVGALILPGCRVRSYNVYLKCVGPEDSGKPGVQCGEQGCDCLHTTEVNSLLEGDKKHSLDGGRGFDLKPNGFFSVPIPSPQKVNKPFRYDHVVVELQLDQSEQGNEDKCYDTGYEDGKFYFPIVDVSPPGTGVCQVQPLTGKYTCPEFMSLFGGEEGAYLQDPYISCYDADTRSWIPCITPNIFTKGEEIKVRAEAVSDGKKYCVKMSTSGLPQQDVQFRQLPVGIPGNFPVEMSLGSVTPNLFTGATTTIVLTGGDKSCESKLKLIDFPAGDIDTASLKFTYQKLGDDSYRIFVPEGISISSEGGYSANGATLTKNGKEELTSAEIREAVFDYKGMRFSNAVGAPGSGDSCEYRVRAAAGAQYAQNEKTISVTAELLQPDAVGNCYNAEIPVKSQIGYSRYTQPINLRLEPLVSQAASQMYQDFMRENYAKVIGNAESIVNRGISDIEDATALYYLVAAKIADSQKRNVDWKVSFREDICDLIGVFKTRKSGSIPLGQYPDEVRSSAEYKKIEAYFGEIEKEAQCGVTNV